MKVPSILFSAFKNNFAKNKKVDLTSFSSKQDNSQVTSLCDKNANESIKNNAMTHISFGGRTLNWYGYAVRCGTSGYNQYLVIDDDGDKKERSYYGSSVRDAVNAGKDFWELIGMTSAKHSNSHMVRTDNRYTTNRIYFADPEENVPEQTKRDHDYIVYDNRPVYPKLEQVRDLYLSPEKASFNLGDSFRNVGEYYYRLELADKKELNKLQKERKNFQEEYDTSRSYKELIDSKHRDNPWDSLTINKDKEKADYFFDLNGSRMENFNQKIGYYQDRINFAKDKQKKAAEGYRIYQEVDWMIQNREDAKRKIERAQDMIHYDNDINIPEAKKKIEKYNLEIAEINEQIAQSEKELEAVEIYRQYQMNKTYPKLSEEQKKKIDDDYDSIKSSIRYDKSQIKKRQEVIKSYNQDIERYRGWVDSCKTTLIEQRKVYEDLSNKVKLHYSKMEQFYRNNIEEWQCS